jgi:hypothetical protein
MDRVGAVAYFPAFNPFLVLLGRPKTATGTPVMIRQISRPAALLNNPAGTRKHSIDNQARR